MGYGVNSVPCPSCALTAGKESVYRVNYGGFARTPREERDWSQPYKDFREAEAEMDHKITRMEEATQQSLQAPPLFKMAKQRARKLMAQGAVDANDVRRL